MHKYIHTYMCTHKCIHKHMHTHIQSYTHAYIDVYPIGVSMSRERLWVDTLKRRYINVLHCIHVHTVSGHFPRWSVLPYRSTYYISWNNLWVQRLLKLRTTFVNPASIWTKNVFHQMWRSFRSVLGLVSSLKSVFATQPRTLSSI